MEFVCVIQREGLPIVFSHRSFQEYFCAYAFLRLSREEAEPLAMRLSSRHDDSVIPMLFEMNRSFLEDVFILPMIENSRSFLDKFSPKTPAPDLIKELGCELIIQVMNANHFRRPDRSIETGDSNLMTFVHVMSGNSLYDFFWWIVALYKPAGDLASGLTGKFYDSEAEAEELRKLFTSSENGALFYGQNNLRFVAFDNRQETKLDERKGFLEWMDHSGFMTELRRVIDQLRTISRKISSEKRKKNVEILSLLKAK